MLEAHVGQFLRKQGLQDGIFNSAAVVIWFFETALLNVRRSHSVNVDFHAPFLFTDTVFPCFLYVNIILTILTEDATLETDILDTPV
jgi:hypothetical protein